MSSINIQTQHKPLEQENSWWNTHDEIRILYYNPNSKITQCSEFLQQRTKCMRFKNKPTTQRGEHSAALSAVVSVDWPHTLLLF